MHLDTINTSAIFARSADFVLRNIHDRYLLVPVKSHLSGYVFNINSVGAFIWNILEHGTNYNLIFSEIIAEYGKQPGLEDDLISFMNKLIKLGVVNETVELK